MRKYVSFLLCLIICFNLIPVKILADENPGVFEEYEESPGHYVIDENIAVTSADAISLSGVTVTVESGVTLTIDAGGILELRSTEFTNNGIIVVESDSEGSPPDDGLFELWDSGSVFTNNGQFIINGRAEIIDGAELSNSGTGEVIVNGVLRLYNGAKISNDGTFTGENNGLLDLHNPPEESNPPFEITGLSFYEGAEDEDPINENPTTYINGLFNYDSSSGKWVRDNQPPDDGDGGEDPPPPGGEQYSITLIYIEEQGRIELNSDYKTSGEYNYNENDTVNILIEADTGFRIQKVEINGVEEVLTDDYSFEHSFTYNDDGYTVSVTFAAVPPHTITVISTGNGTVKVDDQVAAGQVTVPDRDEITFTLEPDPGYMVSATVTIDDVPDDWSWNIEYLGYGIFEFPLEDVRTNMTITFTFDAADLQMMLENNFVVLKEEVEEDIVSYSGVKSSLANQFGRFGTVVNEGDIDITGDIDPVFDENEKYGVFTFRITGVDVVKTGYIVENEDDIIFEFDDGNGNEIYVAQPSTGIDEMAVPAKSTGTMGIFGYGDLIAAPLSNMERDENGRFILPFYCAQFHIVSFMTDVSLYGFYVIQDDALCVRVEAESGEGEQHTPQWDLNRYADLTIEPENGDDIPTSYVFFGNDEFILSIPSDGIGGADSLEIDEEGFEGYKDFGGYEIVDNEDGTYSVNFKSDFYDDITINLLINHTEQRNLRIKRVGVNIEEFVYSGEIYGHVSHGTQVSTLINYDDDFVDGKHYYRIYATYYIPDRETDPPYGLYVTFTWGNGTKTSITVIDPCKTPSPSMNAENFDMAKGVFLYGADPQNPETACCDYLIYSAPNDTNAPLKINVTVLKGDPAESESAFSGIFFGSGAGVEWTKD
ncbi:MAG: hypothetical protein ACOYIF_01775 [Acetivibrionales bacterium]|jgi:hypothetical protein